MPPSCQLVASNPRGDPGLNRTKSIPQRGRGFFGTPNPLFGTPKRRGFFGTPNPTSQSTEIGAELKLNLAVTNDNDFPAKSRQSAGSHLLTILCLICNLKTHWRITVVRCINCWRTHFCSVLVIVPSSADVILPVHRIFLSADFDHNCRQIWNCFARNFVLKIIIKI